MLLCVCIRAWFFTVGSLQKVTGLWHCAYKNSVHCLHGVQQCLGYLSEGKKWHVLTLRSQGCIQAQLATEFGTTQSSVSKWVNNTESLVKSKLISRDYIGNILEPVGIPFGLDFIGRRFIFQDDNAHPHAAHIGKEFQEKHLDYMHMEWPPLQPRP